MEKIAYHPLIQVSQEEMKKVRENYDLLDTKRIKDSLEAIDAWCQKQDHLVEKNLGMIILERLFIMSRGSVEATKKRIDGLFTSRGLMPELSLNKQSDDFSSFAARVLYVPLPKLCPSDQSRVMVTQLLTDELGDFNLLTYFRYCFLIGEYRLFHDYSISERFIVDLKNFNLSHLAKVNPVVVKKSEVLATIGEYRLFHDYSISERFIVDLKNFNLSHLAKVNPVVVKKSEVLATEGFGTKIKGIHILNAPSFVDRVVFILKSALKPKIANRLHVHSSYEDLHKHIAKEILPVDYDGDEQSVTKLAAQWEEELKTTEAQEKLKILDRFVTDESKRQTGKFNEEYMGMPGSFRTLSVD